MRPLNLSNRSALMAGLAGLSLLASAAQAQSVYVEQIGSGNMASIDQSNTGGAPNSGRISQTTDKGMTSIAQSGENNSFVVEQSGDGAHDADITQSGSDNLASIGQSGDAANLATILQGGADNQASIRQASLLSGNSASITQGGAGNFASITQNGDGNSASLTQDGTANSATFSQTGNGNGMGASQTGGNNILSLAQNGDGLTAPFVSQTGNSSLSVTQTALAPAFIIPK